MKFIEFKNFLESKNIILFDHEYRISYYEITNYIKNNNIQKGGDAKSKHNNYLATLSKDDLHVMVKISISSNPQYLHL
jgi:hypothetical protein